VKIGIGSQWGRLLRVAVGSAKDCVMGTLSDVVKMAGTVGLMKGREIVSGSSDGSSVGPS
jgi:hypothetical protein